MEDITSFGYWLRRRRKALDLTQGELARLVGCATDTIKKIESDARRPSRQLAGRLAAALDIPTDEQPSFLKAARAELRVASLPSPTIDSASRPTPVAALPAPPTPLIGRQHELAEVCALLQRDRVRLLTLVGPGGVGKTHLALQAAHELHSVFRDGVAFVALAAVRDPPQALAAIGQALGLPMVGDAAEELRSALREKQLLLVLDNLEQVLSAAPDIAGLLAAAPMLQLLVTSRAVLHLSGEFIFPLRPLAVAVSASYLSLDALAEVPAVALFVARARAVRPDWTLTRANAAAVAAICARLDGLPLAIELVAAHSRLFGPVALLARLEGDRPQAALALLRGGPHDLPSRHQTLRGTLDWSYDLLSAAERALFRRFGVFVGGATATAVMIVCGESDHARDANAQADIAALLPEEPSVSVLDLLSALVDKSLLQAQFGEDGEPRFTMLELIREYALEQLAAAGEFDTIRRRHMTFFLEQARDIAFKTVSSRTRLDQLSDDHANVRAAMHWRQQTNRGTSDATDGVTITYAGYLPGLLSEADRSLLTRFTEETGISVRMLPPPGINNSLEDYPAYRALSQDPAANIDVLLFDLVWVDGLAPYLVDLAPQLGHQAAQYYAPIIDNNTVDGRLVALPWNFDIGMLYSRSDLIRKYELGAPPTTWDELEHQARVIAAGERPQNPHFSGLVFPGSAVEGLTCAALEWLASSGGGRIVEDGVVTLDNPQAIAMLNRVRGWIGDIVPREVTSYGEADITAVFQAGDAAFLRGWSGYHHAAFLDRAPFKGSFAVTPLPALRGYTRVGTFGGYQLGVLRTSRQVEAAIEFVRYMTSPEVQTYRAVVGDAVPALPQLVEQLATTRMLPFLTELSKLEWVARPSRAARDRYAIVSATFFRGIHRILRGEDAATVVPQLASQLKQGATMRQL
jgi:trehalose/maltose transport system substrate-binding protein